MLTVRRCGLTGETPVLRGLTAKMAVLRGLPTKTVLRGLMGKMAVRRAWELTGETPVLRGLMGKMPMLRAGSLPTFAGELACEERADRAADQLEEQAVLPAGDADGAVGAKGRE